jgi:Heparinase II/III-like protein/Heparinase II/III N-terminus
MRVISLLVDRIRTVVSLGAANVARVVVYRGLLRAGLHRAQQLPITVDPVGPYFSQHRELRDLIAPQAWRVESLHFGWFKSALGSEPPDWFLNPFTGQRAPEANAEWWAIPDFDPRTGDIKAVWEWSRFDWVVNMAQQAAAGDPTGLARLNVWLRDWSTANPRYRGHNWKCAQEASIRVMHLAVAARVLDGLQEPSAALCELLAAHLRRIEPTVSYARAQDNNHGTSEAAALFIGGAWLSSRTALAGGRWETTGRRLLEDRVAHLIRSDGSFSQYSVNYHRLVLDTLSLAEVFRRSFARPRFSARFYARAEAAMRWLHAMVDESTGDAPNYGANDGANLLPLTDADVRDFRPSVALAAALFGGGVPWSGVGPWQEHLAWLDVPTATASRSLVRRSALFRDGGQVVMNHDGARVVLVVPHYRFRPSHCDAMHLDFWVGGQPLLRDGGSFSYAAAPEVQNDFVGARGHNTVQLDDREQMPRLGRFMLGPWLGDGLISVIDDAGDGLSVTARYADRSGATHERRVDLGRGVLVVEDRVQKVRSRAVLRWRLAPAEWVQVGASVRSARCTITVTADVPIVRAEVTEGWESQYYLGRRSLRVFEVEVATEGAFRSRIEWSA